MTSNEFIKLLIAEERIGYPPRMDEIESFLEEYGRIIQEKQIRLCVEEAFHHVNYGDGSAGFSRQAFIEKVKRVLE